MSNKKATPRRQPRTRQVGSLPHSTLIKAIVPRPRLADDYIVLAALLHHPELAAPYLSRLRATDWLHDLHRLVARAALWQVRGMGRADLHQIADLLLSGGAIRRAALTAELTIIAKVGDLIHASGIVADAVAILTSTRREAVV